MKIAAFVISLVCAASLTGCASHPAQQTRPLAAHIGERVVLEGIAEPRKLGAAVRGNDFDVWIDRLSEWPANLVGHRVRVIGILEQRHDLPVFVARPGEPIVAGIPVADGTDLHAASLRYVVRDAQWNLIR